MFEALTQLVEKKKQIDKELQTEGEKAIKLVLKEFISKHKNVLGLYWNQYTPYFNDGAECTFRVGEIFIGLAKDDECLIKDNYVELEKEINDKEVNFYDSWALKKNTALYKDLNTLEKLMNDMDSVLESTFGNHVEVLVTSKNIEINDYHHD